MKRIRPNQANCGKETQVQMTPEQELQLQDLDVELQIAEKRLRVAAVKKQIAETELDVLTLNEELQHRLSHGLPLVNA
jgi:hypothetical protein